MKKGLFVTLMVAGLAFAFSSCKKCETCTAYYVSDNTQAAIDHQCGNKIVVDQMETDFKTAWDYGTTYVECKKD